MKNTLKIALDKLKNPYIWLVALADIFLVLFMPIMIFGAFNIELGSGVIFLLVVLVLCVMMLFRLLVVKCYRRYVDDYNARRWDRVMRKTWFEKFLYKTDHAYDQMNVIRAIGSIENGDEERFLGYIKRVNHPVYDSYKHFWMLAYSIMKGDEEALAKYDELFGEDVGKVKDGYMPIRDMLIKVYRGVPLTPSDKSFVNEKITLNVLRGFLLTAKGEQTTAAEEMKVDVDAEAAFADDEEETHFDTEENITSDTEGEMPASTEEKTAMDNEK